MKPSLLKPGMAVTLCSDGSPKRSGQVIECDRRGRITFVLVNDFVGQFGPNDRGIVRVSDCEASRIIRRAE